MFQRRAPHVKGISLWVGKEVDSWNIYKDRYEVGDLSIGGGEEHDEGRVRVSSSCLNTSHAETFIKEREKKFQSESFAMPPPFAYYQSMQE